MRTDSIFSDWKGVEIIFVDQRREQASDISTPDLDLCVFENIRLTGSVIRSGKISRTKFRNCYLRNTEFDRVNLTGCEFVELQSSQCQISELLSGTILDSRIASFRTTFLPNVTSNIRTTKKNLLHELRVHAQSDGQFRAARQLLLRELRSNRLHEWNKAFGTDKHDRQEFQGWDRVRGCLQWILHWIEDIGWGYGLVPTRLLRSAACFLLIISAVNLADGVCGIELLMIFPR